MATRPSLPSMPSIDFTKFEMPKFELPKVDLPTIDLTRIDTTKVTGAVRDGVYVTIGLGVVGVQQATELAKQLTTKVTDLVQRAA